MGEWQPSKAMQWAAAHAKKAAEDFDINPSKANGARLKEAVAACRRVALDDCERRNEGDPHVR